MFRELSQNRMMEIHDVSRFKFTSELNVIQDFLSVKISLLNRNNNFRLAESEAVETPADLRLFLAFNIRGQSLRIGL
jgi:hypothetical protein